ncbi:Wzz/FepE/Etk N-terminal domain-containing protein [Colwellia asteriadis]|uniref:Wzz/FepE/Etk N-terminal domain-containing protein n=1 Tax=Colwellia asteriadis TaxID=517723 RepID=A0ABP3WJG3_9GAMM
MPNTLDTQAMKKTSQPLSKYDEEEILWRIIWAKKLTIIIVSFLFAVASIFFALSKPDIYRATTLLSPVSSDGGAGGLSALAGQFGGLASMAGINLSGGGADNTALALQIIRSRSFLEKFIIKHDLRVPLIAAEKWNISSNKLVLNTEVYDESNNKWIRQVKPPKEQVPSDWEAYTAFLELLTVSQDEKTSMVTIAIEFYSPELAKQWLSWLVADINEFMKIQDQKEAEASIEYLNEQLSNIKLASMKTVFYQLIEEQTKNMMLAHVRDEYVLKTIDPAQVPEIKAKPKRALIVIVGTLLGGFLSVLFVLVRYYIK